MTQHTPGPWRIDLKGGGPWILTDSDARGAREIAWSDADYRLIAAAPEMLEIVQVIAGSRRKDDQGDTLVNDARALLAKIEGRS